MRICCRGRRSVVTLLALAVIGIASCSSESLPTPPAFDTTKLPPADSLRDRIDAVVDHSLHNRTLNTRTHNAWQIVHGILPYGRAFEIERDGQRIGALDWLLQGGALNGWDLRAGDHGVFAVLMPGSKAAQGHPDQWIGYLSTGGENGLEGLKPDEKIIVEGKPYTMGELLTQAEADIRPGQEASWTLMALAKYRPSNYEWSSKDGEKWTVERVAEMEAAAARTEDAPSCGGTHRLYGLTLAVNRYMDESGTPRDKLTGGWKAAEDVVQDCIRKARAFQEPDGSFSTNFFIRPGRNPEVDTTLHSTGHTLEWLTAALTEQQLQEPWVTAAATRACQLLEDNADRELDCGSLYHAARGLILYRNRRFGPRESAAATNGATPASSATAGKAADAPANDDAAPAPPEEIGK